MANNIKLPPLPERFNYTNSSALWCYSRYTMVRDDLGAYVRAEDYDALRNASEALRAEVEQAAAGHAFYAERTEQLEKVLRELVAVFSESGMYDEEVFAKARAALAKENKA